jgi:alkanesulfonate monooxygenase SsuD/methylene tetrahydromethanopterin reductase-like flavin-dependent oxidoreductase (luciferase family)
VEAGLYLNPQTPGPRADKPLIHACVEHAQLAERLGFRAVWITEHAFTGYNAYSDPLVLGAYISAKAPDLTVGFSVVVGALHHPIRFATQAALLDNLSGGRLVCGIGSGVGPDEFFGYGLDNREKYELLDTWIHIVKQAWTHRAEDEPYVYDTPWWRGKVDGRVIPATVQQPHPPVARGTLTLTVAREQGRQGMPLLLALSFGNGEALWNSFLDGLDEANLSIDRREQALRWTGFTQQVFIAEEAGDLACGWEYAKVYISKGVRANLGYDRASPEVWAQRKASYRRGMMLAGSPQRVLDKLGPWAERGMQHVMVWPMFGHMPPERAAETIQRFGEEVLPHLRRIAPTSLSRAPIPASG